LRRWNPRTDTAAVADHVSGSLDSTEESSTSTSTAPGLQYRRERLAMFTVDPYTSPNCSARARSEACAYEVGRVSFGQLDEGQPSRRPRGGCPHEQHLVAEHLPTRRGVRTALVTLSRTAPAHARARLRWKARQARIPTIPRSRRLVTRVEVLFGRGERAPRVRRSWRRHVKCARRSRSGISRSDEPREARSSAAAPAARATKLPSTWISISAIRDTCWPSTRAIEFWR